MASNQRTNIWIDGSQAGSTLTELKRRTAQLNLEIRGLARNSEEYRQKMAELRDANAALQSHRDQIRGISNSYTPARAGIKSLIGQFLPFTGALAIAGAAIGAVVGGIKSWYENNKAMEKSLSSLRSLTGASTEDIRFYKKEAIEIGKTTQTSAIQAVEAYKLIGSARPELLKNKEALAEVAKQAIVLAEAAEMDLGVASESLAGSMNQFNLSAEHSERIINALAAGSKEGAAEISDVTASIEKFGTVADANNVTFEESVALTELMAEKNIKNAEAGNQLKNVLLTVSTASALPKDALLAMEQYGVNLSIVTDKTLPLKDRLTELSKIQKDQNALVKVFGRENIVAGQTILNNIDKFDSLTKAVTGTNTAYEQQAINNDNLDGDLKKMGTAWEGLTLSMDGSSSIFRGIVQTGTAFLKWITDTINAFKEWDITKIETSLLQLLKIIPFYNILFGEMIDQQIRLNQLTSAVIDGMKDQADASTVLTESLKHNNEALKSGNLTAEEQARIQEENKQIIAKLNEQYPELTKHMDLQSMSAKELSELQKDINKNLMQQSIAAVQAAEAERILSEIVQNSMKIAEQRAKESKRWAVTNWVADVFADDAEDIKKSNEKLKKDLKSLPKTMKEVEKQIAYINPQFGVKFKENANVLSEAYKEIKRIKKELETATGSDKRALEAELKAQRTVISNFKSKNKELKESALNYGKANDQTIASEEKLTKSQQVNYKAQQDAKKKHLADMKKLQDELNKIILEADKLQRNIANQKTLDSFKEEKQKELFELQNSIEEKYQAEIESARKLMAEKGDIGRKATEQYNRLIALEDEEYELGKAKIEQKYRDQKYEEDKNANLQYLEQQRTLEDSVMDLKVTKAKAALNAIREGDLSGYRKAKEDLENALKEQAELQKTRQIEALMDQQSDGIISTQEFNNRKQELELEYQQSILEINKQTAEELKQIDNERLENSLNNITQVLAISKEFSDAKVQNEIKSLNREKKAEQKSLDDRLENKTISEDQYKKEKEKLDRTYAQKKYEIDLQQFKKNQAFAIAEAAIQGALAIVKVTAQTGAGAAIAVPLIIASTAAQVATIEAQTPPEAPQYQDGGYTEVIGAKDGLRYRAKRVGRLRPGLTPNEPSLALISEKGSEYFVPHGLLRHQRVARHVAMIEAIRTNQYADGGYTSSGGAVGNSDDVLNVIKQNTQIMTLLYQMLPNLGINFTDKNIEELEKNQARLNKVKK